MAVIISRQKIGHVAGTTNAPVKGVSRWLLIGAMFATLNFLKNVLRGEQFCSLVNILLINSLLEMVLALKTSP